MHACWEDTNNIKRFGRCDVDMGRTECGELCWRTRILMPVPILYCRLNVARIVYRVVFSFEHSVLRT